MPPPPPPPPPPGSGPPPPPPGGGPPPPPPSGGGIPKVGAGRGALLKDINNFKGAKLKKVQTNDRSAPLCGVSKQSGGGTTPAANGSISSGTGPSTVSTGGMDFLSQLKQKHSQMASVGGPKKFGGSPAKFGGPPSAQPAGGGFPRKNIHGPPTSNQPVGRTAGFGGGVKPIAKSTSSGSKIGQAPKLNVSGATANSSIQSSHFSSSNRPPTPPPPAAPGGVTAKFSNAPTAPKNFQSSKHSTTSNNVLQKSQQFSQGHSTSNVPSSQQVSSNGFVSLAKKHSHSRADSPPPTDSPSRNRQSHRPAYSHHTMKPPPPPERQSRPSIPDFSHTLSSSSNTSVSGSGNVSTRPLPSRPGQAGGASLHGNPSIRGGPPSASPAHPPHLKRPLPATPQQSAGAPTLSASSTLSRSAFSGSKLSTSSDGNHRPPPPPPPRGPSSTPSLASSTASSYTGRTAAASSLGRTTSSRGALTTSPSSPNENNISSSSVAFSQHHQKQHGVASNQMGLPPPPPLPPPSSSSSAHSTAVGGVSPNRSHMTTNNNNNASSFEGRFGRHFLPAHQLPDPPTFNRRRMIYPSTEYMRNRQTNNTGVAAKRLQAPPPPPPPPAVALHR